MLGIGALFSMIFHIGTKEKVSASRCEDQLLIPSPSQEVLPHPIFQWKHWLKEPSFYQVNMCWVTFCWFRTFLNPFLTGNGHHSEYSLLLELNYMYLLHRSLPFCNPTCRVCQKHLNVSFLSYLETICNRLLHLFLYYVKIYYHRL